MRHAHHPISVACEPQLRATRRRAPLPPRAQLPEQATTCGPRRERLGGRTAAAARTWCRRWRSAPLSTLAKILSSSGFNVFPMGRATCTTSGGDGQAGQLCRISEQWHQTAGSRAVWPLPGHHGASCGKRLGDRAPRQRCSQVRRQACASALRNGAQIEVMFGHAPEASQVPARAVPAQAAVAPQGQCIPTLSASAAPIAQAQTSSSGSRCPNLAESEHRLNL